MIKIFDINDSRRVQGTTPVVGHNWRIRMDDERYIIYEEDE